MRCRLSRSLLVLMLAATGAAGCAHGRGDSAGHRHHPHRSARGHHHHRYHHHHHHGLHAHHAHERARPERHASRAAAPQRSPRQVLAAYLDATFAGHHAAAWALLSSQDQSDLSRHDYIERQHGKDQLRRQVSALGPTHYAIGAVQKSGDSASAIVTLKSGLGANRLRFVLRKQQGKWRIAYSRSWQDVK